MQEAGVYTDEWRAFWKRLITLAKTIPNLKGKILEEIGDKLTDTVKQNIISSQVNDQFGRVQGWQKDRVGSYHGYVAVSADSVPAGAYWKGNELNAGAVTNFLESGHSNRGPSGRSKRYRPEIQTPRARTFGFYKDSGEKAERLSIETAEEFLEKLSEELNSD